VLASETEHDDTFVVDSLRTAPTLAGMTASLRTDFLVPHPARLSPSHPLRAEILAQHTEAVDVGRPVYRDPASGLAVFTARFLADRGYCCDSGCRHCPYLPPRSAG
jgi:hypothetical protein